MWHEWRQERFIKSFGRKHLLEKDHLKDLGADGRIILK
jgi:hypothetical protein